MRKLPIGRQDFGLVRMKNMAYVDKTGIMYRMIKGCRQCFIARPPCFGKSLLLNALESLFSKGTEMFRGLAIEKLWTEKACKVLHPGFSGIDCRSAEAFEREAVSELLLEAEHAGIIDREKPEYRGCKTIAGLFRKIAVCAEDLSMVLLIDEYDSPLRHSLQDREASGAVSAHLRAFYSVVRQYEGRFRFIFVTGIMRFSNQIFGYGQSISDISRDPQYGALPGFTEEEIRECSGRSSGKGPRLFSTRALMMLLMMRPAVWWSVSGGTAADTALTMNAQCVFSSPGRCFSSSPPAAGKHSLTAGSWKAEAGPISRRA